jgi:hypothetical protein
MKKKQQNTTQYLLQFLLLQLQVPSSREEPSFVDTDPAHFLAPLAPRPPIHILGSLKNIIIQFNNFFFPKIVVVHCAGSNFAHIISCTPINFKYFKTTTFCLARMVSIAHSKDTLSFFFFCCLLFNFYVLSKTKIIHSRGRREYIQFNLLCSEVVRVSSSTSLSNSCAISDDTIIYCSSQSRAIRLYTFFFYTLERWMVELSPKILSIQFRQFLRALQHPACGEPAHQCHFCTLTYCMYY